MSLIKNGEITISRYASLEERPTRTLTVQTALDGTEYLTRFGSATMTYNVSCYVDFAGKAALEAAADALDELEVRVRRGVFHGRIKSEINVENCETYGWYKCEFELSAASEVSPI